MKTKIGVAAGSASALMLAVAIIGQFEGLSLSAYPDRFASGLPTICYGETRGVNLGDRKTKAECDLMLADAVREFEAGLNRCIKPKLHEKTKAALVSWSYNVGVSAACRSTLVAKMNAGDLIGACNELSKWNKAGGREVRGLTNRRAAERALCLEGLR